MQDLTHSATHWGTDPTLPQHTEAKVLYTTPPHSLQHIGAHDHLRGQVGVEVTHTFGVSGFKTSIHLPQVEE